MSNPFIKTKHTKAEISAVFGKNSDSKLANEIAKNDHALYRELRAEAEILGIVDRPAYFQAERDSLPDPHAQRHFSDEELTARGLYSQSRCTELLRGNGEAGNKDNLGRLAQTDPAAYRMVRIACRSYDLIPRSTVIAPLPVEVAPVDTSVAVGRTLEEAFGLPEGFRASSQERLNSMVQTHRLLEETKAAKLEGERTAANAAAFEGTV